jgi:pyruvate/2-oxoglutarate/acetoin dehydrogenase E1 component
MSWLGEQPDTVFLGQQVRYSGNGLYSSLAEVPNNKKVEMPVMEDSQLGMAIGMSLVGKVPISIYPRMNFLVCAMNQLYNHLDKMVVYTHREFKPHVIVRVCVGTTHPMNPGVQHSGEYNLAFEGIRVVRLKDYWDVFPAYQEAYQYSGSTILVEYASLY